MRSRIGEAWNRFTTFPSCLTITLEQQLVQSIISSLWNFQNSKCELTTDHKAVEKIVLISHFFPFQIVFSSSLIHSISIEFPKQKMKTYHSKSVLNPYHRIHTRLKHKCFLLFLLIKLALLQFLKLLQKCPSSFVGWSVCMESPKKLLSEWQVSSPGHAISEEWLPVAVWAGVRKV